MGANGNINDLELAKFIELAGQYGIRVHFLHGDSWLPSVADVASLPPTGNTVGDIRQTLDTGSPYRWSGSAWAVWSASGVAWGEIAGTLSAQTDLQNALNGKIGSGAYVLVSRDCLLTNQINLGSLTSGILKQTVAAGVSTISILTDNSGNWNTAYTHSQIAAGNPHGTTKADIGLGNVDNTSDVNKPVSTAQATADTAALNAAKAYADGLVVGLLDDRGNFNASANTWPSTGGSGTAGAILKGDLWTISVAGTLGGVAVTAGDVIRALVDTPGTTAANWAISENNFGYTAENSANKDASGGYAGLTLFKINARNAANTITSFFTNAATTARTWTFPDKDGTVAMTSDITGTNSGTNTGDETLATLGTKQFAATGKTTPVDADSFNIFDSAASNVLKLLTFTNFKSFLKAYFDTLYPSGSGTSSGTNTGDETLATIKTKLGITTLSGSNTGDETNATILSKIGYTPANDGGVVHLAGTEQIGNGKSFYDIININSVGAGTNSIVRYYNATKNWYVGLRGDTSNNWSLADDTDFRFVVQSGGNVGIGTTSPSEKLEVAGAIIVGNTSGTNAGAIRWNGTKFQGYTGSIWVDFH